MKIEEFIAEIETTFSIYAESGDLNRNSIVTWVIQCLRQMGNNITDINETVVEINNSYALLPSSFKSLKLALKLKPEGHCVEGNVEDSYIYKQRIENPAWFNHVTHEYETTCESTIITEKIFTGAGSAKYYYSPEWLSLTKGIKKDVLSSDCLNINSAIRNAYPNEISITGRTLNTNFKSGYIYIQYNSLPTDEDGELVIPVTTTGDLYHYVENYVKAKIAEDLILNNKNPIAISQYASLWEQKMSQLKASALRECKFGGLSKGWETKFAKQNKRNISIYELPKH